LYITVYSDCSLPDEENGVQKAWIQLFANKDHSAHNTEWAEAWFALDALMHRTCHIASSVNLLQEPRSDSQISDLIKPAVDAHRKWQDRLILIQANEIERTGEIYSTQTECLDLDVLPVLPSPLTTSAKKPKPIPFLDYPPANITDTFFANRLNNWRALGLYLSLIQQPLWGKTSGKEFVNGLDVCRSYAACGGSENNFFGAEKAIGLYLAGIVFGGPDMYSVRNTFGAFC
jgi:hypothetical protein